jgi:hypothetical protein
MSCADSVVELYSLKQNHTNVGLIQVGVQSTSSRWVNVHAFHVWIMFLRMIATDKKITVNVTEMTVFDFPSRKYKLFTTV